MSERDFERSTLRKVWWHIVPLMAAGLLFNLLDRANIAFAALQMNEAFGFSNTVFGLSSGFFAVGVVAFGIPSTLLLHRLGARRWIAISLVAWGVCSGATAFVGNLHELLVVRLLLGMAEAGFIPGAVVYFSSWFPSEHRGRVLSSFVFIQPIGLIVGGPLSGWLLSWDGHLGLAGWQWLFIVEALPAILLAPLVLRFLTDKPAHARWLTESQKQWLQRRLAAEQTDMQAAPAPGTFWQTVGDGRVLVLAGVFLALGIAGVGAVFFIPLMIRSMHFSIFDTGLIAAVPPLAAALAMPLWGRWADRVHRRQIVVAAATGLFALGLFATALLMPSPWAIAALSFAMVGFFGSMPPFWTLPSTFLSGASVAAGVAFISVTGNIGHFIGPYLFGWTTDRTGSYATGLVCLGVIIGCAALTMLAQFLIARRYPSTLPR